MEPLVLTHYTLTNCLGPGIAATRQALHQGASGLRPCDFMDVALDTFIGRVDGLEEVGIAQPLAAFDCRNNRLAQWALSQDGFARAVRDARDRYRADRIAVVVGTSTSGILETELAYRTRDGHGGQLPPTFRYRHTHDTYSSAAFVRAYLGLQGPALAISTACSSSAKAFASAYRMMAAGICDCAVVGGVDSLCGTTLHGFASLELVSRRPCRPADATRDGISIGEGAGFALLERRQVGGGQAPLALLGYGESSDAYHMSSPQPEGVGAEAAIRAALERADVAPDAIDYVNLHGTATPANDSAEDRAVTRVFGHATPCSSTKGWTGHTLGAAGITEAIIGCLCVVDGFLPQSLNTETLDPGIQGRVLLEPRHAPVSRVVSNSFGFGGNNCALVLGRAS